MYYPFGWNLPGRKYQSSSEYAFGFNGKMNDKDWGGQLIQDDGFRLYNPAIGKFLSVDPLARSYPYYSPYQFSSNSPLLFVDMDGLEPKTHERNWSFVYNAGGDRLGTMLKTPSGEYVWREFDESIQSWRYQYYKVDEAEQLGEWEKFTPNNESMYTMEALGEFTEMAFEAFKEGMHTGLDVAGMIPVIGEVADGINAVFYTLEGDFGNAAVSLVALIPVIGDGGKVVKYTVMQGSDAAKAFTKATKKGKIDCKCFTEGTLVKTDSGYVEIQKLELGDLVWAYDQSSGALGLKEVIYLHTTVRDTLYKLYVGGEVIETTNDHPFYSNGQWIEVQNLHSGDVLTLYNGTPIVIDSIKFESKQIRVYNFTVKDYHTYFVSNIEVLAHNCWGSYRPKGELPRKKGGEPAPDPEATGAHTIIGTKKSRKAGEYTQAREFDGNGNVVKDIDFTDHGRPKEHPFNPHQHKYLPNKTGGTPTRSNDPEPLTIETPYLPGSNNRNR